MKNVTRASRFPCRILVEDCKPLWRAMDDLRRAGNRILTELYLVRQGEKSPPEIVNRKGEKRSQPLRSYAYSLMAGTKGVEAVYKPEGREVCGGVKSAFSSAMYQRMQTDWVPIKRGEKSLSNIVNVPLYFRASEVRIVGDDRVRLILWARGSGRSCAVTIRLFPRKAGQRSIWKKVKENAYKLGNCSLNWDRNKRKWFFGLSYTKGVEEVVIKDGDLMKVLGVDVNMANLACCEAMDSNGNVVRGSFELFDLPIPFWRLFERKWRSIRGRHQSNKIEFRLREGRGRERKLRVVAGLSLSYKNIVDNACRNLASAIVRYAKNLGCCAIAIEDFSGYDRSLREKAEEKDTNRERKRHYRRFLRFNRYKMHQYIKDKSEENGIEVVAVRAAYTSKDCHVCGQRARQEKRRVYCDCGGLKNGWMDRDRNAARNIANRGIDMVMKKDEMVVDG